MSKKEEKKFEYEDKQYLIKELTADQTIEAQRVYTKEFKKAVEDGAILKQSLEEHMRDQGLWDDEMAEKYTDLVKQSADLEYKIKSGAYKKASELRDKAFELKKIRNELTALLSVRNSMDSVTAEGLADNERFFYLVSACVYDYLTQKPVYSSLQDYKDQADSELAVKCASEYANVAYGLEENYQDAFVENKLLKRLNLLNDKGQLINRKGQRVDTEGNLLDEEGARIDADGNRIDINNNLWFDDDVVDELEFEDDLAEDTEKEEKPKRKTRASAKKKVAEAT